MKEGEHVQQEGTGVGGKRARCRATGGGEGRSPGEVRGGPAGQVMGGPRGR